MYAAVRRSKTNPGSEDEGTRRVQEGFVPLLHNLPGFTAYYVVSLGKGEMLTITLCETAEAAEESNKLSADWTKQSLGDVVLDPPRPSLGEVLIYETK